jgi:hypothetical protein
MSAEKIAIINEHLGKAVEAADLVLMDLRPICTLLRYCISFCCKKLK